MKVWDCIVIGGGFAGLSAAIYLSRALRSTLVIDDGKSLGRWEPEVQNYLGFPEPISGEELLRRGKQQAEAYKTQFAPDIIESITKRAEDFELKGQKGSYRARKVLLATGLYHLPPEIPGVNECLGHSMFFCKDCDGYRVQGKTIGIIGRNNDAVRYSLGLLAFSPCVFICTNGKEPHWNKQNSKWVKDYEIPVYQEKIVSVDHQNGQVETVTLCDGRTVKVDCLFTTRGDIYHNTLAEQLGAKMDEDGQVIVDQDGRTSVKGLYAAGCVTQENCQMIIAAGAGATSAQAINSDLLAESLENHSLRHYREEQLDGEQTVPETIP